ncbi:serine acetyltransferase [Tamlana sp. 2201CG12-4]|uniref:serine O-acetyltransferase n=1 Tax=Tamlana sp. 2201CG12-4 TaxID=3112582 RepID=UPI002DBA1B28|nr:serine acetyltransferase [Tamlana sp. 2201CG12-4]MEC3906303.1 serine acetyltransferase [Tamlana sp. 2201CG12-4]
MQLLLKLHRLSHKLHKRKVPILPKMIYYLNYLLFNSSVPPEVVIGRNTIFAYGGIGVVIHKRAIIGDNCNIGQGITIGGRSKYFDVPKIRNNVYIGAGARVLGPITVGNETIIAPNSVVLKNIPDNCMVAGVPAMIKKENIKVSDFV